MKPIRSLRHQSGFSLLEVMLVVGIAIAVGGAQLTKIKNETEWMQAEAAGKQLAVAGRALNEYMMYNRNRILTGSSVAGAGDIHDPGPRSCVSITTAQGNGWQCTITTQTLQRVGVLPLTFSGVNSYGSTYEYVIRVEGTAPDWRVQGMVRTARPYANGGTVRHDLIGRALSVAGSEAGTVTNSAGQINGLNGLWVETGWGFGTPVDGMLAYRAGFGTAGFREALRSDGTTAFTDDLDMGGNSINGVGSTTVSNDIRAGRYVVNNMANNSLTLGQNNTANRTVMGNDGNRLRILNSGGVQMLNSAGAPTELTAGNLTVGAVTARGSGSFAGDVQARGMVTTNGQNIHSSGAISAVEDFFTTNGSFRTNNGVFNTGNGNLSAPNGRVEARDLVVAGSASIGSTGDTLLSFGTTGVGWFYQPGSNTMNLRNNSTILETGGQVSGGSLITDTTLEGNRMQINGKQSAGISCAANTFATDSSGKLMECVGGTFSLIGGAKNITTALSGVALAGQQVSATCPAGYKLIGGGWQVTQRNNPATDPYAPSKSYADAAGNRWIIENINTGHTAGFRAQVVCTQS